MPLRFISRFSRIGFLIFLICWAPYVWGDAPVPVRLLVDWYPQAEHGGYFCALVKGYYKEAGLDVQIFPLSPGTASPPQVAVGKFDLGLGTSNALMVARKNGFPLVCVMATMQHDPQCIMVHDDSPIHSFPDLNGHTVSAPPGSVGLEYVAKKFHLTDMLEERSNIGTAVFVAKPDFIQQAFVTAEPYFVGLKGVKTRCLLYSDVGEDPYRVLFTTDSFLRDHPDVVKKFVAASIKGWNEYLTDPKETDDEIKKNNPAMTQGQIDFSRGVLRDQHFINNPAKGETTGGMTVARWDSEKKVLVDIGLLPADFDVTKVYTLAALPSVETPTGK